ncbi:MAG: hypothetical protein ACOX4P_06895 [Anaerovoracaceae bacterium]|jgi:hypothetical protein
MENNNYIQSSDIFHPIDSVMKSVFLEELSSIGIDIAETGIDSLLDSEVLKDIPIVKTVGALAKVSLAIRDKHLLKKLLFFIETLNQGNAKPEEIEKRKKAAQNNEKWLRKEIELITIHIDRLDELEKAQLTAAFYIEYINQNISWIQYREYLAIIERVFFQDFIQLLDIYDAVIQNGKVKEYIEQGFDGGVVMKKVSELNCDRLIAVGLVKAKRTPVLNGNILTDYDLTGLGLKLAEVLVKIKKDM